jgi:hypothetical protein
MLDEAEARERQIRAFDVEQPNPSVARYGLGIPTYSHPNRLLGEMRGIDEQIIAAVPLPLETLTRSNVLEFQRRLELGTKAGTSWLFDVLVEIDQLPEVALALGLVPPTKEMLSIVASIIRMCEATGLSEPAIDCRENGEVEIFCREGEKGLLLVVNPNNLLQVFGDFSGDTWRARYELSGAIWRVHLISYFRDLILQVSSPPISALQRV